GRRRGGRLPGDLPHPGAEGAAAAPERLAGRVAAHGRLPPGPAARGPRGGARTGPRSEEHTSELQSRFELVCRLLLEKKKTKPQVFEDAFAQPHARPMDFIGDPVTRFVYAADLSYRKESNSENGIKPNLDLTL